MKTHDIVSEADGWAYILDGVYIASYPSWLMAINAARTATERDVRNGLSASLRYQGLNGEMRPLQTRSHGRPVNQTQLGLQPQTGPSSDRMNSASS